MTKPIVSVDKLTAPGTYFSVTAKHERGQIQMIKELRWLHENYVQAPEEKKAKWARKLRNFTKAHKHQMKVIVVTPGGKKEEITLERFLDIVCRGWRER